MRHLVRDAIVLCGTSLLRNAQNKAGHLATEPQDLLAYVEAVGFQAACAETNFLNGLNIEPHQRVILVHTSTSDGRLCAEVIREAFFRAHEPESHHVILLTAEGLESSDPGTFVKSVRQLAVDLKAQVEESRRLGHPAYIGAVGGFKPMVMVAAIVAAETSTNLYYIRQDFADPVEIDLSTQALSG